MIWIIRLFLGSLIVAPFIGALAPGLEVAQAENGGLGGGDIALALGALSLAALSTGIELVVCMLALSIILSDRRAVGALYGLLILVSALFLIPAPLRARAFLRFWEHAGLGGGEVLWILWSITFNTIFFWAVAVAYTQSPRFRSSLYAVHEMTYGLSSMLAVTRMFAPALAAAGVASFVVNLMSGRELSLLTTNGYPLGAALKDLIGGRDQAAALLCGGLVALLLTLIFLTWRVSIYTPRRFVSWRRRTTS